MRAGSLSSPSFSSLRRRPMSDRRIRPDPTAEQIEINIAAGQHETDALARQSCLVQKCCGERGGAGAFGEIVRVGPERTDRERDFIVRYLDDTRGALEDDRER